jgi:AcrR family transcriptional regulator
MSLVDAEGLDALSIRRLAGELEVSPMALYWHFADKDALLAGISERLWNDVRHRVGPASTSEAPPAALRRLTEALVAVLRAHPGCAPLAPVAVLTCEAGLEVTERALQLLAAAGVEGERAASLANFFLVSAMSLVAWRPGGLSDLTGSRDGHEAKMEALRRLPADRYPHLAANAGFFVDCADDDRYFDDAVEFLIGGLFSRAAGERKGSR